MNALIDVDNAVPQAPLLHPIAEISPSGDVGLQPFDPILMAFIYPEI